MTNELSLAGQTLLIALAMVFAGAYGIVWFGIPQWGIVDMAIKMLLTGLITLILGIIGKIIEEELISNATD